MFGRIILPLALTLLLLGSVSVATAATAEEMDVTVMSGAAIPFAKEDHLVYGIVKVWNKASTPITATLSIAPNRNHPLDDNKYWGNYRKIEDIKIGANELRIQVYCFVIPANSNAGRQTWTLNVSMEKRIITKEIVIDLPATKNVEVVAPSWQPDILKLDFPPATPDTIIVEASKPKVTLLMLKVAGDLSTAKIYDVQIDTTLPDIFFSYPKKITMAMSEPENWDFENQEFLPFTAVPVPLLTVNIPYSNNGNMYEVELQMEEKGTGMKTSLPFQLVVTMPTPEKTVEAENAMIINETADNNETAIVAVVETVTAVNSSETLTVPTLLAEEAGDKTDKNGNNFNWPTGLAILIIFCCVLTLVYKRKTKS